VYSALEGKHINDLTENNVSETVEYSFLVRPTPSQISQIIALYRMAEWWTDDIDEADQIAPLIAGSHCYCTATIDKEIVGIGRAISDGISDAYIQDITVDKSHRRLGIASCIVNELVQQLNRDGLRWIALIAERGTQDFYGKLGFEPMSNSAPMLKKGP
jgi:ribosomal protein S18 acetylase RimI-like enzyme